MSKYILCLSAAWLLFAMPLAAQDDAKAKQEPAAEANDQEDDSPKARLKVLRKGQTAMQREMSTRMREAQREAGADREAFMEAMQEIEAEMKPEQDRIFNGMLEVAAMADEDEKTSLRAIGIVLREADAAYHAKAGELLAKHHANNEEAVDILGQIRMPTQAAHDAFKGVIENTESDEIRAKTSFALMNFVVRASEMAPMLADNPQIAESYPEMAEFMKSDLVADMNEEAMIEQLKGLADKYGDVELEEGNTIAKMVARKIKAIEIRAMVGVGKTAPDIVGPDIDGEEFKLSDYRGKVVMLDFWGDW